MITGRYPQSNGLMEMPKSALVDTTLFPWDWACNDGERNLSHILKDAGYYTAPLSSGFSTKRSNSKPSDSGPDTPK